jgi:23S rRNA (uracil1939-C5)-methyltransferase
MNRKKKKFTPIPLAALEIIDIAEEGKGVGKAEDMVIFVEKAVPGDIVDVLITRKKKNFAEATIDKFIKSSDFRESPFCSHFGTCGGCKWQHMAYAAQLQYKQQSVESALQRIGKVDVSAIEPILASEETQYYRNKLEYTFSNKRWLDDADMLQDAEQRQMDALGFHVPGRFDKILNIEHCYLQANPSNEIRLAIREFALKNEISFYDLRNHAGALRNLIIRTASTGELMVAVVFAYPTENEIEQLMSYLKSKFSQVTSLLYIVNQKKNDTIFDQEVVTYSGRDYIFEEMPSLIGESLRFKIGVKSFYQTNSAQAHQLYQVAAEFAELKGDELVYDLYTGAGTIANFVAGKARQVVGVEYVPTAIEDAKFNSQLNKIDNTVFFAGDMKDILTADFVAEHGSPDLIITDPPRAGMHPDVLARLLEIAAPRIVYVSCNAATQARDLEVLSEKYVVQRIKPVDMFPQTQHVENVVSLILK